MGKWGRLTLGVVVLSPTLALATPAPAIAQECMVGTFGPLTLASRESLTLCATNLEAQGSRRVGLAFLDAFNAREPLRLEYVDLAPGAGACHSFRPARDDRTIVVRAGFIRATTEPEQSIALSAQKKSANGTVDAADYVVWRKSFGTEPTAPV